MLLGARTDPKVPPPLLAATDPVGHVGDSLRILPDRRQKQQQPQQPRKRPRKPDVPAQAPPETDQPKHIDDYA
jgi:hypothetical protein